MITKLNKNIKFRKDNILFTGLKPFTKGKSKTQRKHSKRVRLINSALNLLSFTIKIIWWLLKVFFRQSEFDSKVFDCILISFRDVLVHRGLPGFISHVKNVRGAFSAAIAGEQKKRKDFKIRCHFDGIPKCFGESLTKLVRVALIPGNSKVILQLVYTLLCCTRALSIGSKVKTSTITESPKGAPCDIARYTWDFWRTLGYPKRFQSNIPEALRFKEYHFSTKNGPNGHAVWTSLADFIALDANLRADIEFIGGKKIISNFKKLDILIAYLRQIPFLSFKGTKLRKLVAFPDKEDKMRVVALLDYYSQTVLRPLHLYLFRILKKIPQDCTFKQESFIDKIKDWDFFCSADLSAATDRFPLKIISEVLKGHLPVKYINAFERILVERPFQFGEEELTYATGNPMGAYASWSSFTISHHYVMYYCCRKLNIDWQTAKYCMLGDDIVIGDEPLADLYIEVMTKLGVEINSAKTHKSKHFCEFAKRLILQGEEISPFPISSLKESQKRYYTLVNLFMELEPKGYKCIDGISAVIYSYYEYIKPTSSFMRARWRDESHFCEHMTLIMRGAISASEGFNNLVRQFDYKIRELNDDECLNILSNIAVETFIESSPAYSCTSEDGEPLGLLASSIVTHISGLSKGILRYLDNDFSCIPLLFNYGKVEENYISLLKLASAIEYEEIEWPELLTTMSVPLSDKVFIERTSETVNRSSAMMGIHLRNRLDFLETPMGEAMIGQLPTIGPRLS